MDYYSVPRRILRGARQLVYPRRCPFCDRVLGSVPVCPDCAAELEELRRKPGMRLDASQPVSYTHLTLPTTPYV